ncbi:hypothetical protein CCR95_11055 [Thiocystis minor]|uniref:XdhC family protein n=1 Tax=Thiocystis minor TaxID=61597 RepID=UPI001913DFD6|nr:XdhC/CoxI family protein [Thiocystis minor]MBK5964603.1 hypothetical protein [Thiocystis minor]
MLSSSFCQAILTSLVRREPVANAMILAQRGSSPRHAGARMLVRTDGSTLGSLGGGSMEAQVIDMARAALADGQARCLTIDLGSETGCVATDDLDMLCGGETDVLIHPLDPAEPGWLSLYRSLSAPSEANLQGWLITRLTPLVGQWLVRKDDAPLGVGALAPELAATLIGRVRRRQPTRVRELVGEFLVEPLLTPRRLLIFGAGHIGLRLARLAAETDFAVWVLDDRAEFVTSARFPRVDRLIQLDGYEQALTGIELGQESDVVILTHGHAGDLAVLRQALHQARTRPVGYLGMIGSRRKWERMRSRLETEGFATEELARVHCPIGLAIGAETPAEIAISILAELIGIRSARLARSDAEESAIAAPVVRVT